MKNLNITILLVAFFVLCSPIVSYSQEGNMSPLGFKFGINKKQAMKVIDSKGKRIYLDEEDSKEMRVILFQGVIVDTPIDISGKDVMTELEFYKKKLFSTSLVFAGSDKAEKDQIETEFDQYFTSEYGEPVERDSMMYFTTTSWDIPNVKLILHTNTKENTVKVEYKHKPGHQAKFEDELDQKRGTVHEDPATQMFLDGDFTKPTGYDEQYGIK